MSEVSSKFTLSPRELAPNFSLPLLYEGLNYEKTSSEEKVFSLYNYVKEAKGFLIAFVCNHCPYVTHLSEELGKVAYDLKKDNILTISISSNDIKNYPDDSPDKMIDFAKKNKWDFPYLYDASQEVAKMYDAACTPDFYLFNSRKELSYAGQFDNSRPNRPSNNINEYISPTGESIKSAVNDLLSNKITDQPWPPSSGCNIKWK